MLPGGPPSSWLDEVSSPGASRVQGSCKASEGPGSGWDVTPFCLGVSFAASPGSRGRGADPHVLIGEQCWFTGCEHRGHCCPTAWHLPIWLVVLSSPSGPKVYAYELCLFLLKFVSRYFHFFFSHLFLSQRYPGPSPLCLLSLRVHLEVCPLAVLAGSLDVQQGSVSFWSLSTCCHPSCFRGNPWY